MDTPQQLRVGLIGCGYQGQWLARAAAASDAFCLTACTDPDVAAVTAVQAISPNVQPENSVETLIANPEVDVVFIATPHYLLQPYALQDQPILVFVYAPTPASDSLLPSRLSFILFQELLLLPNLYVQALPPVQEGGKNPIIHFLHCYRGVSQQLRKC